MSKHTPGPWKANGQLICNAKNQVIGEVNNYDGCDSGNADLIGAGPELLESLKSAVELHGQSCGCGFCLVARPRIAKAEGGSNE